MKFLERNLKIGQLSVSPKSDLEQQRYICLDSWFFAFNKAKTDNFNSNRRATKKLYNLDVQRFSKNDI